MATVALVVADTMVERLLAAPSIGTRNVTRKHRTPITREDVEKAGAVRVQAVRMRKTGVGLGCVQWRLLMRVSVSVRSDESLSALDPLLVQVLERIAPENSGAGIPLYPSNLTVELEGAGIDENIADLDLTVFELEYHVDFFAEENKLEVLG